MFKVGTPIPQISKVGPIHGSPQPGIFSNRKIMFTELAQTILAGGSSIAFTVTKEDDKQLRVVVMPSKAQADETSKLNQPILVIDTPENLDAQLGAQLASYQLARQETISTVLELESALKEEAAASRKKSTDARARTAKSKATPGDPATQLDKAQAEAKAARTGEQLTLGATPASAPVPTTTNA